MQDEDTANKLPRSGDLSASNGTSPDNVQDRTHPRQKTYEELKLLQRILVVEDDTSLANLEADVLKASGYAVTIAHSGELAVMALHESIPDLVVLDLDLPGSMTGWDVLHMLRMHSKVPVLLTSSETAVRKRMRTCGETRKTLDHLPKPYAMQALLKRIAHMLVPVPQ